MNELLNALNQTGRTENDMKTNLSSKSAAVDLFFRFGAMRGQDIIPDFSKAFADEPEIAGRIALWGRDVRGGAGERQLFKDVLKYAINKDKEYAIRLMNKVPELGRWDDLLVAEGTKLEEYAFSMIAYALVDEKNGLCAKWMPRKGKVANKLRKFMKLTPKEYRKLLVNLTKVVETQMCAKDWDNIEFGKVPSLAHSRYAKAFGRNTEAYAEYLDSLKKGEAKINAGAIYPYDVIKNLNYGNSDTADEQWKALPDYCKGSDERVIPVVDVSGSMSCPAGENANVTCMDVSISLGLYLSERLEGPFKDHFITFSANPELQSVNGSLSDRFHQMRNAEWGMNTDFNKVFDLILNSAVSNNVSKEHMPTMIIVLSDMEFDASQGNNAWRSETVSTYDESAIEMIRNKYEKAGYEIPKLVYWNIQSRSRSNVPVTTDDKGTALVSGFSPSIMTSILSGKDFSPVGIMKETIMKERYDF